MSEVTALSVAEAMAFLEKHERHYKSDATPFAAIGLLDEQGNLRGAAILGINLLGEAQLCHIYCDGAFHGYTMLYGSCWRAFHALGYQKVNL